MSLFATLENGGGWIAYRDALWAKTIEAVRNMYRAVRTKKKRAGMRGTTEEAVYGIAGGWTGAA